jgi:peptidyl-prolyl cis-trans isomerase C
MNFSLQDRFASSFRAPRRVLVAVGTAVAVAVVAAPLLLHAAEEADPVVARVNGAPIHQSDLKLAEEDVGNNLPPMPGEAKRDYLIGYLTDVMLVAKAAEDKKVSEGDTFKRRLSFMRNKLLMEQWLQSEGKSAVTDAAMHKVYDDAVKQMGQEQEVRARHILVETEDEAKAVQGQVNSGTDFAELAKQKSKDPGAAEGGDLGYFAKEQMVPEFSAAAFKLEKGQVSDPVKSQFGWHIIKVEDKRQKQLPEFDKVKDQIETFVVRKAQSDVVAKLRESAKIERLDAKPADAAAQPANPAANPAEPEKK